VSLTIRQSGLYQAGVRIGGRCDCDGEPGYVTLAVLLEDGTDVRISVKLTPGNARRIGQALIRYAARAAQEKRRKP